VRRRCASSPMPDGAPRRTDRANLFSASPRYSDHDKPADQRDWPAPSIRRAWEIESATLIDDPLRGDQHLVCAARRRSGSARVLGLNRWRTFRHSWPHVTRSRTQSAKDPDGLFPARRFAYPSQAPGFPRNSPLSTDLRSMIRARGDPAGTYSQLAASRNRRAVKRKMSHFPRPDSPNRHRCACRHPKAMKGY